MRDLIVTGHLTNISMWIESLRLLPTVPRHVRVAFASGLGICFLAIASLATAIGFHLAQGLPKILVAALLFVSPMSFLMSSVRNARLAADRVALVGGVVLAPVLAWRGVGLDLMWTGLIGGVAAYAIHRARRVPR